MKRHRSHLLRTPLHPVTTVARHERTRECTDAIHWIRRDHVGGNMKVRSAWRQGIKMDSLACFELLSECGTCAGGPFGFIHPKQGSYII